MVGDVVDIRFENALPLFGKRPRRVARVRRRRVPSTFCCYMPRPAPLYIHYFLGISSWDFIEPICMGNLALCLRISHSWSVYPCWVSPFEELAVEEGKCDFSGTVCVRLDYILVTRPISAYIVRARHSYLWKHARLWSDVTEELNSNFGL